MRISRRVVQTSDNMNNELGASVCTFQDAIEKARVIPGLIQYIPTLFNLQKLSPEEYAQFSSVYTAQFGAFKMPEVATMAEDNELVKLLMPIFFNNRTVVMAFLDDVDGAKPVLITETVNKLLSEKKISRAGCKKELWEKLHDAGLYKAGFSNWCARVNA